jgi:hypothetical protein
MPSLPPNDSTTCRMQSPADQHSREYLITGHKLSMVRRVARIETIMRAYSRFFVGPQASRRFVLMPKPIAHEPCLSPLSSAVAAARVPILEYDLGNACILVRRSRRPSEAKSIRIGRLALGRWPPVARLLVGLATYPNNYIDAVLAQRKRVDPMSLH